MSFLKRMFYFILLNFLIVFTAGLISSIIIAVFGIKGQFGSYLVFYSLIGFGGAFLSLFLSRWFVKKTMGVRILDPKTARGRDKELIDMVYQLASKARLPKKPEVGIYDNPRPNAFATGPTKSKSLVAFSSGLISYMNDKELEGVIAHELAHISNGDMVTMTLLQGLINTMVLLAARLLTNAILSRMRQRSFWMEISIYMSLQVIFSIFGSIFLSYYSRKREYRADKDGARLSGIENMILALKALNRMSKSTFDNYALKAGDSTLSSNSYRYLQISGKDVRSWLSTHPPLEDRIARLERLS